jgi:hypothetical protein
MTARNPADEATTLTFPTSEDDVPSEPEPEVEAPAPESEHPLEVEATEEPVETPLEELDRIDPAPDTFTFTDGTQVGLERLRTRQFFKMMRIFTHGSIDILAAINLDPRKMSAEAFTENLIAVLLFAVPESEQESIDFLRSLVKPKVGAIPNDTAPADLGKATEAALREAEAKVNALFENPELDDLLGLVEAVVRREAPEIKALGKRVAQMMSLARKTGNLPSALADPASSEPSPERST